MKQKQYIAGRFSYKTDIGKVRLNNEDQAYAAINARGNVLLLVCDGMGGQNKGDMASSLAVKTVSDAFSEKRKFLSKIDAIHWSKKVIREANSLIFKEASKNVNYHGMGTTLTMVLIIHDYIVISQVGDSRAYTSKNREVTQISEDQTYVAYLYRTGQISKEELLTHPKRHVLMNALGIYPALDLDVKVMPYAQENILVCSDGLYNNLSEKDISSIIVGDDSTEQKVNQLIAIANSNGGSDNIAVVLWEVNK